MASFTASATSGFAPLSLNFINSSTGSITSYAWTFGDGTSSTSPNPVKAYTLPGVYTVKLQVTGPGGSNLQTKTNYITVTASGDKTPPSIPAGPWANALGSNSVRVSWMPVTDNVGVAAYRVERCRGAGCTSFAQVASVGGTAHIDSGLASATTYRYRVRAVDAAGNASGYSSIATFGG